MRSFSSQIRDAVAARPDRVRAGVELALALALAIQLGQLVWIVVQPRAEAATAASPRPEASPADYTVFQRFDAFFRTGDLSSLAEATAAGGSQMRLFGVRAGGAGGGSAIIGLADGRQVSVGVGEEVEPGLILQSVGQDHVTLARGASVTRLIFSDTPIGAAPPPPPPPGPQTVSPPAEAAPAVAPAVAAGPRVDPARLMAQASLRPRMQGLRVNGFTVSAGGDGSALKAAGLQSGDVILAVNGTSLDRLDRIAGLRGQLSNAASAEIRFERGGAVQTTTIRTGR
ncbi:MAG: type II secretion system protein N [Brevundimonas sp.]|uniref:type II secretion system protein N n=2 Tax=Brevundimonas sp. TaxID=1871086 RepID=UPI002489C32C|nr:type II secretion system protein N [Brevundimonas sp.]MDI1326780.1 type II secretion system protein N [Brevundimonas sp.]